MRESKHKPLHRLTRIAVALLSAYAIDGSAEELAVLQAPQQVAVESEGPAVNAAADDTLMATPPADSAQGAPPPVVALAAPALPVPPPPAEALETSQGGQLSDPTDNAVAAAVADGVTTGLAVSAGAIESNPLVVTSPVGLVALTGLKIGMVKYADTLPQEEKRTVMKTTSAVWGGAAVNNLLVLMAAPPPFPIVAGLLMGFATWNHMNEQYQKEDELIAAREVGKVTVAATTEAVVTSGAETSGR